LRRRGPSAEVGGSKGWAMSQHEDKGRKIKSQGTCKTEVG